MTNAIVLDYPRILGEVAIPTETPYEYNKAQASRKLLSKLRPGKALVVESIDHREARNLRAMLYTMSILQYGEAGKLKTKINDNILTIWLVD